MELGKFKRVNFDEADDMPDWLLGDEPQPKPQRPQLPPAQQSRVKSTEGFTHSAVKLPAKGQEDRDENHQEKPTVSIQIHLPEFRLPKPSVPWRKLRPWLVAVVVVAGLLVGGSWLQGRLAARKSQTQKAPVVVQAELGYKPLAPQASTGTETQAPSPRFDEKRKLYSFNDTYRGANITVDQQAVPEKLKGNDTEIKKLATQIQANSTFTTALGTVHIFTSEESGSQRMFLVNDRMLMFIQSTKTLSNADWVTYIQALDGPT